MVNVRNIILGHLRLKVLSLLVACVVWLLSTGRDFTTYETDVTMILEPPAGGVILAVDGEPGVESVVFKVELHGPGNRMEQVIGKPLTVRHSFSKDDLPARGSREVGTPILRLERDKIADLPKGVEIRKNKPELVKVEIDRLEKKYMKVAARLVHTAADGTVQPTASPGDGCAEGYRIKSCTVQGALVEGPQSILTGADRIDTVETVAAHVRDLSRSTQLRTRLVPYVEHPKYRQVPIICSDEILINVEVEQAPVTLALKDVPVRVLRPVDFPYVIEISSINDKPLAPLVEPKVDIEIKGAPSRVRNVKRDDVRVYLDAALAGEPGRPTGGLLTVHLPEGISLEGTAPRVMYVVKRTAAAD